jgi:hypothetical protein
MIYFGYKQFRFITSINDFPPKKQGIFIFFHMIAEELLKNELRF